MSTMEKVRKHRKEVHGIGRFLCDDCSVGFKTKNLLQQHQCLAEQSTLKVFDELPRERKRKDTGCRKKIKLEVKNGKKIVGMLQTRLTSSFAWFRTRIRSG